jgi:AAA ATPase domain
MSIMMPGINDDTAMNLPTTALPPVTAGQAPGGRPHGRRGECELLDRLVADVRAGQSRVLVLRGEPGTGKTVLLDYLAQRADGCRVARVSGVEPETEMAFAGLHQLCAPFLDRLGHLPDPQRDALYTAFNMRGGNVPDRFAVGMATLSLLSELASERPLVCLVDDAQWLDQASAQALTFVARHLAATPAAVIFAVRRPADDRSLAGLPEFLLGGLADADARTLLDSVVIGPLDERVRDRSAQ